MKSFRVKFKKTNQYFIIDYNCYNSIDNISYTDKKEDATIFQEDANTIINNKGEKLKIGSIRNTEFGLLLYLNKITTKDITVENFETNEQSN